VPLNRPALTLGSGPRGVQDARHWVVGVCRDIGREDLIDSAELGVSELATNAVLHGAAPIEVRVRGTREHPRVEVRDGSRESPVMPGSEGPARPDDVLLTFGRGLAIVARVSDAWGAEIEDDGKVVWFAPAPEIRERGVPGVVHGEEREDPADNEDAVEVEVCRMPVALFLDFRNHFRELSRELRLLSLTHGAEYPVAAQVSELFTDLLQRLRRGLVRNQLADAMTPGATEIDTRVRVPRSAAPAVRRILDALDVTDAFCRQERLLSLARTPEQRDFQNWLLSEFLRQGDGLAPTPWAPASARHVG
jgi:anti-sigma regulatory factor (Ser/Thr protein kinase)